MKKGCGSLWQSICHMALSAPVTALVVFTYTKVSSYQAISVLERGLALCQEANIPLLLPGIASYLGHAYALDGRITEALS